MANIPAIPEKRGLAVRAKDGLRWLWGPIAACGAVAPIWLPVLGKWVATAWPEIVGLPGLVENMSAWKEVWDMISPTIQILIAVFFSTIFGVWLNIRTTEWRLRNPDLTAIKGSIDRLATIAPHREKVAAAEVMDIDVAIANLIARMASRGQVTVWGEKKSGHQLEKIPADFWIRNRLEFTTLMAETNHQVSTIGAAIISMQDDPVYCDLHLSIGDERLVAQRVRSERGFGHIDPYQNL